MTGPCLCGDPACGRCFPSGQPVFRVQDLIDTIAAWAYRHAAGDQAATLKELDAVDVAWIVELAIAGMRRKLQTRDGILAVERAFDSALAERIFDLVREYDLAVRIGNQER